MKLPVGVDEELELLDQLSSPELEDRAMAQERQRELLQRRRTNGEARPKPTGSMPGSPNDDLARKGAGPPEGKAWGASLAQRRGSKPEVREPAPVPTPYKGAGPRPKNEPAMNREDQPVDGEGMTMYSVEEFRRAFPNRSKE